MSVESKRRAMDEAMKAMRQASEAARPTMEELIRDAIAEEREACAKLCEREGAAWADAGGLWREKNGAEACAKLIRERGNQ